MAPLINLKNDTINTMAQIPGKNIKKFELNTLEKKQN